MVLPLPLPPAAAHPKPSTPGNRDEVLSQALATKQRPSLHPPSPTSSPTLQPTLPLLTPEPVSAASSGPILPSPSLASLRPSKKAKLHVNPAQDSPVAALSRSSRLGEFKRGAASRSDRGIFSNRQRGMIRQALNSRIPPPTLAAPRRKKDASWYIEPVVSGWDQELEWCFAGLAATRQEWQGYVPCPGASWDWSQDTDLASPAPNHDTGVEGQGPRLRHQAPALPHTAAVETRDHGGPLTSIEYVESEIRTTISEASLAETALENEMDAVAEELADPAGSALTDDATAAEAAIQADAVIGPLDMASTEKIVVLPSARLPLSPNSPSSPGALPNTANDASFIASPPRA